LIKNTNQNKSNVVNFGMDFVKEFSIFLHEIGAIKFGDFSLSSGKKSKYYVDLRLVPSYPLQFRKMIKHLQNNIIDYVGLDNFDSYVSIPTGGLVIASALAIETVKPLIYVRAKAKSYGTSKSIEGRIQDGMKVVLIDDVSTTGGSVVTSLKILNEANLGITDTFVIVDRLEGATDLLKNEGVSLHSLTNILDITKTLHEQNLVDDQVLKDVEFQINNK
jgi:orotate phosphoribosyltransferase